MMCMVKVKLAFVSFYHLSKIMSTVPRRIHRIQHGTHNFFVGGGGKIYHISVGIEGIVHNIGNSVSMVNYGAVMRRSDGHSG